MWYSYIRELFPRQTSLNGVILYRYLIFIVIFVTASVIEHHRRAIFYQLHHNT